MNDKRLIVNADDFGMSRGISDAIVLAHRTDSCRARR